MPSQDCPLCGNPADFNGQDYGKRKAFSCPDCTEFIITPDAESRLKESPPTWKEALSKQAKTTPEGKVLHITIPDRHQPDAANKMVLRGEYQPREN